MTQDTNSKLYGINVYSPLSVTVLIYIGIKIHIKCSQIPCLISYPKIPINTVQGT